MKRTLVSSLLAFVFISLSMAQDPEPYRPVQDPKGPAAFQLIVGPRLGASYVVTTPAAFTDAVDEFFYSPEGAGDYRLVMSVFGLIAEQRILLGDTGSHFAFQEVVLIAGLEQAIALPSGAFLIGYRAASGLEFGVGPTYSFSGIGVVAALGWTFALSGAYVPVDVSVVLPNRERPASIAITTGFNFLLRSRYGY